jgi:glutaredoxin
VLALVVVVVFENRVRASSFAAISSQDLIRLMNQGALVLDIRKPDEFAAGHVNGAKQLPSDQILTAGENFKRFKEKPVIVYCQSGRWPPRRFGSSTYRASPRRSRCAVVLRRGERKTCRLPRQPDDFASGGHVHHELVSRTANARAGSSARKTSQSRRSMSSPRPRSVRKCATRSGRRTVPQIFIGDHHVGGSDDLAALEAAGKLDGLLGR